MSFRISLILWAALLLLGNSAEAAPEISQLQVQQPVAVKAQVYSVTPALKISFNLAAPASVTVEIRRHLASYFQFKWPYLQDPYLVRTLSLGQLSAGPQTVSWDGLDDKGQPLVEVHNITAPIASLPKPPTKPEDLTETVPVNFLQVNVKAGSEQLSQNFERATGNLEPYRSALPFRMGSTDKNGDFFVADFSAWAVYRYSPNFSAYPDNTYPRAGKALGDLPAECSVVHVDSKGNALIMDVVGVWRFDANGVGAPWPHKADYIGGPEGIVLGSRVSDAAKANQPGFSTGYTGMAIDGKDNIYLAGKGGPNPFLDIFTADGALVKRVPLPAGKNPGGVAWAGNDTVAVGLGDSLELLDATSGAVTKTITEAPANYVQADQDGNIYAGSSPADLWRYTPAGDPLPFNSELPYVKANHIQLFPGDLAKLPVGTAGFAAGGVGGLAFSPNGSFYASENPPPGAGVTVKSGVLHYAKDGTYLSHDLLVKWGSHTLANVYLDDRPATMDLLVTNFSDQKTPFTVAWTLTDFDGKQTTGTADLSADPLAREVVPFTLNMPAMGHYNLEARITQKGKFVENLAAQLARIPSRPIFADRYSPFAVAWTGEWEVMALAGAKSSRGDQESWSAQVEPVDGLFFPEHYEDPQWARGGFDALRAFGRKWGFYNLGMLDYGEPWLGAGQIYNYDRFYDYCLHVVDTFAGKGEAFYQFWNEPNFYWRYASPDPFAREEFGVVLAHVWSMVKARDKNVFVLGDGDAGSIQIMQDLYDYGASGFSDTLEEHYPAATPLAYNNMQVPDLPETKAIASAKLVALRDKLFPGKQVWNTEENIPANPLTPEVAATNLPRVEIPQFAVGVDKIYQFSQTAVEGTTLHDVTAFLDENGQPFPTYVSYATMSRLIDGATFVGQADFGIAGAYGYLFVRPHDFVLVANTIAGTQDVTIDAGSPSVTTVDLMGRAAKVPTDDGKLKLTLSQRVQYVVLPRTAPAALAIAKAELKKELDALEVATPADIPSRMTDALKTAATDLPAMNKLYHLVKAAQVAEAAGQAPAGGDAAEAKAARQAVEQREGDDGYLRQARIALDWAEHLAQITANDPTMAWPALLASQAAESLAHTESPAYPGAVINAYIGEPGAIEKIRATVPVANKPETGIDNQFRFQIDRKPGDTFELELTVCDYYRHPLGGTVTPRLPAGWRASPPSAPYSVQPEKWQRFLFTVTIPAGAKPGVFSLGGQTTYNGATVPELHAMRVKL